MYHKNVPGGADFPERNNLSASNRAEERFIRPAARTFRVGEIYYIAYRILTIFPFRSISVQVTRHRVPYIISRVSSDHGRTLFTTLRHFRLIRIRESSTRVKCVLLFLSASRGCVEIVWHLEYYNPLVFSGMELTEKEIRVSLRMCVRVSSNCDFR